MKEYVLSVPAEPGEPVEPAAGLDVGAPVDADAHATMELPRQPLPWRALLCLLLVEPIALAALYFGLIETPTPSVAAPGGGVAYVAAFVFPATPAAAASAAVADVIPEPSRITHEHGKFVIDLHATDTAEALDMLRDATGVTVIGSDALLRQPARVTRSAVAATALEAWQSVFGDVANFAASCNGKACTVRIVSVVDERRPAVALPLFVPPIQAVTPDNLAVAVQATPPPVADQSNGAAPAEN